MQDQHNLNCDACGILQKEQDFYDLMYSYLYQASARNVYVAEIFLNPQAHIQNNVALETVLSGISQALTDGRRDFGIKGSLLMSFLKCQLEEDALKALEESLLHTKYIVGIEVNCDENGNLLPHFRRVYKRARELGLFVVAHLNKGCVVDHARDCDDTFQISRFNLGLQCPIDPTLVQRVSADGIAFTLCPLADGHFHSTWHSSSDKVCVKDLFDEGLRVIIVSDHPAYYGGHTTENFLAVAEKEGLTKVDIRNMCKTAFNASFISPSDKEQYFHEIDHFTVSMGYKTPPRSITIFGSRAALPGSVDYDVAYNAGKLFASRGFRVVTGGYSGVMEAAAKGAVDGARENSLQTIPDGGHVGGCAHGIIAPRVFAPRGLYGNTYNTDTQIAHTLIDRLCRLLSASEYFLALGGTIGTITEIFLVWNEASVRPIYGARAPKIFLWRAAWEAQFKELGKCISAADMELIRFVDSLEEVLETVEEDFKSRLAL